MKEGAAVFMSVPDIEGSSTFVGFDPEIGENSSHVGWIPVSSCGVSVERNVIGNDPKSDETAEHRGAKIQGKPFIVKRKTDFTTAELMVWLANASGEGRKKDKVLVDYVMPSGRYYLRYELEGVELVGCSIGYQEPDDANETLTFTYDRLRILQRPVDESGAVDSSKETAADYEVFTSQ